MPFEMNIFAPLMNISEKDIVYMNRCLGLAERGRGKVAPNPMVGAVLVHDDRIIGEGYHEVYGEAHAEVNCIRSVSEKDKSLISSSTLYVSLEPCAHYGKTPPCADLIVQQKIPKVVIGCTDSFDQVNGKGIEKLLAAGIEVISGVLEKESLELNKRFFTFHQKKRPYIILKWAQTANALIGRESNERLIISGAATQVLVHQWRSEEQAILVGTHTAIKDNPQLTDRYFNKRQPLRIVLDRTLKIPSDYHIMNAASVTYIMNGMVDKKENHIHWIKMKDWSLASLLKKWHEMNIQSIIVEGGATLLNDFIRQQYWDEIRVIENKSVNTVVKDGIRAPLLPCVHLQSSILIEDDKINTYVPLEK